MTNADLEFSGILSFSSTSVDVHALTDAGRGYLARISGTSREFADAIKSVNVRKSASDQVLAEAHALGLKVEMS
jgi:hypothetical protein